MSVGILKSVKVQSKLELTQLIQFNRKLLHNYYIVNNNYYCSGFLLNSCKSANFLSNLRTFTFFCTNNYSSKQFFNRKFLVCVWNLKNKTISNKKKMITFTVIQLTGKFDQYKLPDLYNSVDTY